VRICKWENSGLGKGLANMMKEGSGESNEIGTGRTASVSLQLDSKQGETPSQTKVPSPNDAERASLSKKVKVVLVIYQPKKSQKRPFVSLVNLQKVFSKYIISKHEA